MNTEGLVTYDRAAELLAVSVQTVRRLVRAEKLDVVQISEGNSRRVTKASLAKLIESSRV